MFGFILIDSFQTCWNLLGLTIFMPVLKWGGLGREETPDEESDVYCLPSTSMKTALIPTANQTKEIGVETHAQEASQHVARIFIIIRGCFRNWTYYPTQTS